VVGSISENEKLKGSKLSIEMRTKPIIKLSRVYIYI